MSDFYQKVYATVKKIPKGNVASYGQIATLLGNPGSARLVGWALRAVPDSEIPWHRVVSSSGHLTITHPDVSAESQKLLLESEGVMVTADNKNKLFKVDMNTYRWRL